MGDLSNRLWHLLTGMLDSCLPMENLSVFPSFEKRGMVSTVWRGWCETKLDEPCGASTTRLAQTGTPHWLCLLLYLPRGQQSQSGATSTGTWVSLWLSVDAQRPLEARLQPLAASSSSLPCPWPGLSPAVWVPALSGAADTPRSQPVAKPWTREGKPLSCYTMFPSEHVETPFIRTELFFNKDIDWIPPKEGLCSTHCAQLMASVSLFPVQLTGGGGGDDRICSDSRTSTRM